MRKNPFNPAISLQLNPTGPLCFTTTPLTSLPNRESKAIGILPDKVSKSPSPLPSPSLITVLAWLEKDISCDDAIWHGLELVLHLLQKILDLQKLFTKLLLFNSPGTVSEIPWETHISYYTFYQFLLDISFNGIQFESCIPRNEVPSQCTVLKKKVYAKKYAHKYWPRSREIMHLVMSVCPFGCLSVVMTAPRICLFDCYQGTAFNFFPFWACRLC